MSQLTFKGGILIIAQVLIFSAIFYGIGAFLGYQFGDIPLSYIDYQASDLEKIVYGGFAILLLGWTILLIIFRGRSKPNRIEEQKKIIDKLAMKGLSIEVQDPRIKKKAKAKPLPKKKAKLRSKDGN